jgi:hypothetical protein
VPPLKGLIFKITTYPAASPTYGFDGDFLPFHFGAIQAKTNSEAITAADIRKNGVLYIDIPPIAATRQKLQAQNKSTATAAQCPVRPASLRQ